MTRIATWMTVASVVWLSGCPSPNMYGVPRTTPRGEVTHALALEGGTLVRDGKNLEAWPSPFVYQVRVGVHDRIDVGARLGTNLTLGADAKWNFVRTRKVDLAVAAGANAGAGAVHGSDVAYVLYGHLPLLVGLNVSEALSLIATTGLTSLTAPRDTFVDDPPPVALLWRAGVGMDLRLSPSLAVQPEVTLLRTFAPLDDTTTSRHLTFVVAGVAARFGRLPDYGP